MKLSRKRNSIIHSMILLLSIISLLGFTSNANYSDKSLNMESESIDDKYVDTSYSKNNVVFMDLEFPEISRDNINAPIAGVTLATYLSLDKELETDISENYIVRISSSGVEQVGEGIEEDQLISEDQISAENNETEDNENEIDETLYVDVSNILNVRDDYNSSDSNIIGTLYRGDEVDVYDEIINENGESWAEIKYEDETAYISYEYLSEEEPTDTYNHTWQGEVLNSYNGVANGPSGKETYYNLDMNGVISIMRSIGNSDTYWVREDGVKMLGNYVMIAADLSKYSRGSLVETSLGTGIVCDTGSFVYTTNVDFDVAVAW